MFDGHGGKAAATFASRNLSTRLQSALKASPVDPKDPPSDSTSTNPEGFHDAASHASGCSSESASQLNRQDGGSSDTGPLASQQLHPSKAAAEAADVAELKAQALKAGMHADAVKRHNATDDIAAALPTALVTAFENTQTDFFTHTQVRHLSEAYVVPDF